MRNGAKRFETVLDEQLRDPALREQWERTAVARAVAIAIIRYRVEHGLSQKQLAERLGWKQSAVLLSRVAREENRCSYQQRPRDQPTGWATAPVDGRTIAGTLASCKARLNVARSTSMTVRSRASASSSWAERSSKTAEDWRVGA